MQRSFLQAMMHQPRALTSKHSSKAIFMHVLSLCILVLFANSLKMRMSFKFMIIIRHTHAQLRHYAGI
jgi:hypothetical protein